MMTVHQRIVAVANMFGIPSDQMSFPLYETPRFGIWVRTTSGRNYRLGYFDGNMFTRENPVTRTLRRYKVEVREGVVGNHEEPQYDLHIDFNDDGTVKDIGDNRASMEAMF